MDELCTKTELSKAPKPPTVTPSFTMRSYFSFPNTIP